MQIILRSEMENLGKMGDVVHVKGGYARNFLIPRGLAYAATKSNLARLTEERRILAQRALKEQRIAGDVAAKLNGMTVTATVMVGEEDRMFGSVTSQDIAELLREKGIDVDRRKILLEEPLRALGEFQVPIKLHTDVTATINVEVAKEKTLEP
ncbi:50S ribosomal protein L9 [bacterium]|nr:50S ribosomal protein L9 [bacterium]